MLRSLWAGLLGLLLLALAALGAPAPAGYTSAAPISSCCSCTIVTTVEGDVFWGCPCNGSSGALECVIQGDNCQNRGICV